MTHCARPGCKLKPWRGRLCYRHWRESQGDVFDLQLGKFVKAEVVRADTHSSATPQEESSSLFPRTQERADVGLA
jgi:hypothetical protein